MRKDSSSALNSKTVPLLYNQQGMFEKQLQTTPILVLIFEIDIIRIYCIGKFYGLYKMVAITNGQAQPMSLGKFVHAHMYCSFVNTEIYRYLILLHYRKTSFHGFLSQIYILRA